MSSKLHEGLYASEITVFVAVQHALLSTGRAVQGRRVLITREMTEARKAT